MILTCPDCSTRYSVKDGSIGPNGRTVRCSTCSATWFVSQEADELALADMQNDEIQQVETPAPRQTYTEKTAETPQYEAPIAPPAPDTSFEPIAPAVGAHVQFRDKVDRQRRNRRLMGVSMIWVVTLGLLGTFAVLGYVFRQNVVAQNPALSSLYKALNISVTSTGLKFEDPATRHIIVDGRPVLVVNGMIMNTSDQPRPVPMIELSFVNKSGDVIAKWLVEPEQSELGPRERMEYMSQYPNPPLDAQELKYRFLEDDTPVIDVPLPPSDEP